MFRLFSSFKLSFTEDFAFELFIGDPVGDKFELDDDTCNLFSFVVSVFFDEENVKSVACSEELLSPFIFVGLLLFDTIGLLFFLVLEGDFLSNFNG